MAIIRDPDTGNYYNTESGERIGAGLTGDEGHAALLEALTAAQQTGIAERAGYSRPAPTPEEHVGAGYKSPAAGGPETYQGSAPYQEWGRADLGTDPNTLYEVVRYTAPGYETYWRRTPVSTKTIETTRAKIEEEIGTEGEGWWTGKEPVDEDDDDTTTTTTTDDDDDDTDTFDVAGGYYNDLLELQALELAAQTQLQRDQQALSRELGFAGFGMQREGFDLQRELGYAGFDVQRDLAGQQAGLGLLDLAMRNRGPENAIQYSNLARGLAEGQRDYPTILRRVAGMKRAGSRTPNPFLGMVDLNRLPGEATGGSPGILRAFNPYQVSLQELNRLSGSDFDLLVNSLESAGGDPEQYASTLEQLMPGRGAAAGRLF